MVQQSSDSNFNDFFDASDSFDLDYNHDSVSKQPNPPPESQSFLSSTGFRRRPRQTSKQVLFQSSSEELPDFDHNGSNASRYKFSWNMKNCQKLNEKWRTSSGNRLHEDPNGDPLNSSVITNVSDDASVNDQSVAVDSRNSGSNFLFTLAGLIIKAIAVQTTILVTFLTFPIWLTYSSYIFLTDPFAIMRRLKRYILRKISMFLRFCLGKFRWIVYQFIKRNKSTWKLFLQIGWGLMWSFFVGLILVGLLLSAFVISGAIMKSVIEKPVHKIEQLSFDYTRDTPMAFVPLMSCPEPFCLECNEKIKPRYVAQSRGIPLDHKLQVTVSLTLPESYYNRNLGIFQVRVDFLSGDGKSIASTTQPCMMRFKSQTILMLMTVFKLAPLITGYSSESQTLNIKFKGYTEREIPTSCLRVVLEPRAEFAKNGGVPEIYSAYVTVESQLPFLKRILWSLKATVFVWISIVIFVGGLVFLLLCCTPVAPWLRPRDVTLNNDSRS